MKPQKKEKNLKGRVDERFLCSRYFIKFLQDFKSFYEKVFRNKTLNF
ncbi:MAG: hypothetical protein Ct9H90mP3_5870 [Flammeovirgaceae bacterium]|nr:MAG: hypothetical protein Ct9H90mP3_5870 [Flammeovirgaceae bacterium]